MYASALSIFAALILLTMGNSVAAPVYECTDARGQRSYSQTPSKNCRTANLGTAGFYTAAPIQTPTTTPTPTTAVNSNTSGSQASMAANATQIQAAQQQLNEARRALDEGKQVRYGNERNYAKYLERIAGLEAAVQQSEQALQRLQSPTDNTQ